MCDKLLANTVIEDYDIVLERRESEFAGSRGDG